jgi:hypothetical protein
MVACGALQLLPAYEYGKLAYRWVGAELPVNWKTPVPYSVHQHYSLRLISLFGIVFPGMQLHVATFSGIIGFVLAISAVAGQWRRPAVRLLSALAAGALLVSFGYNSVLHGILNALVPAVEKARLPAAAFYLFSFAVAALAAVGMESLIYGENKDNFKKISKISGIFGGIVLILSFGVLAVKPDARFEDRFILTGLLALFLALVIRMRFAGNLSGRGTAACCLGFVLLELGNFAGYTLPHREEKNRNLFLGRMAENSDIVQFLRRQAGPFRIEVDDREIPFNFGDWHGIEAMGGYLASLSANLVRAEMHSDKASQLMNVKYSIAREPKRPGQVEVFSGSSGLKVFENPNSMERAWTVHEIDKAVAGQNASAQFSSAGFDLRRKTFVEGDIPQLERCSGEDQVQVLNHTSGSLSLAAQMRCRGMVVVSATYFPGWTAKVDGRDAEIREVYGVLRGVVVDAGAHIVEMRYRPLSVVLGGVLSALGFLITGILWLLPRRFEPHLTNHTIVNYS